AVKENDNVTSLDARLLRRAICLRLRDKRTFRLLKAKTIRDVGRHRLNLTCDPAARDRAVFLELGDNAVHGVRWDCKGDADRTTRGREDRRVDSDHIAISIECWPARITLVNWRIDLNEIIIGAGADITTARRHDAGCAYPANAKRISHFNHPIPNTRSLLTHL